MIYKYKIFDEIKHIAFLKIKIKISDLQEISRCFWVWEMKINQIFVVYFGMGLNFIHFIQKMQNY